MDAKSLRVGTIARHNSVVFTKTSATKWYKTGSAFVYVNEEIPPDAEIIWQPPYKVGDIVYGDDLDSLPVGAAIIGDDETLLEKHDNGKWYSTYQGSFFANELSFARKIVWLPLAATND